MRLHLHGIGHVGQLGRAQQLGRHLGVIDLDVIGRVALAALGGFALVGGALTMEPFLMPGGEVGRDISVYRDLRDGLDLDAEARRACDFTRTKLQQSMRS